MFKRVAKWTVKSRKADRNEEEKTQTNLAINPKVILWQLI